MHGNPNALESLRAKLSPHRAWSSLGQYHTPLPSSRESEKHDVAVALPHPAHTCVPPAAAAAAAAAAEQACGARGRCRLTEATATQVIRTTLRIRMPRILDAVAWLLIKEPTSHRYGASTNGHGCRPMERIDHHASARVAENQGTLTGSRKFDASRRQCCLLPKV